MRPSDSDTLRRSRGRSEESNNGNEKGGELKKPQKMRIHKCRCIHVMQSMHGITTGSGYGYSQHVISLNSKS